ncbi:MAG: hypothetical protein QOH93_683 [Chloroflexia bacterium]|jgi:predicted ATPase/transcriptional regulator with XRE-family HTH domain|nr:hypothetical protein [Chloroflexia bacterium]
MDRVVSFSGWLKEQRKQADLTQRELAQAIGCSEITIKKLESGKLRPSKSLSKLLADYFNVAPEEQAAFIQLSRSRGSGPEQPPAGIHLVTSSWQSAAGAQNLPAPINSFVGRTQEIETLTALLLSPDVRLVSLTGAPGVGKTRLALELAARLRDKFQDSVRFVPLASVTSPELVAHAIERALGLSVIGKVDPWVAVHRYLQGRRLLLVLDNFEHLLPAAMNVSDLLAAAPDVKVVVTSRQALDLYGEHRFELLPLAMPVTGQEPVEDLLSFGAVQLFVDRARSSSGDFDLTRDNAQAVVDICERLDGLPLAIELAAGHVRSLPPQDILTRLRDSEGPLGLLAGGPRNLMERQRALSSTLEWSYNLLDASEKQLFRAISAFAGAWTLDAVHSITATALDDYPVLNAQLQSLVDKSLLRQYRSLGEPRYYMLATLREFARARAQEEGEAEMLRTQHARYYLRMAEMAEETWIGPQQGRWIAWLEDNYPNLNAALEWALEDEKPGGDEAGTFERHMTALRLCAALTRFWRARGMIVEGRKWLDRALSLSEVSQPAPEVLSGDPAYSTPTQEATTAQQVRVKLLYRSGDLASIQGDLKQAFTHMESSLALARQLDDRHGIASALNGLGVLYQEYGDLPKARAMYEESLQIARELSEMYKSPTGLRDKELGDWADNGPYPDRETYVYHVREANRWSLLSLVANNLAGVLLEQGELVGSDQLLEESMAIKRQLEDRQGIARTLVHMGKLAYAQGQYAKATGLLEEGLEQFQESRDKGGIAWSLRLLAYVEELTGHYDRAQTLIRQSLTIYREMEYELLIHLCLLALGRVTLLSVDDVARDPAKARGLLWRAARLFGAAERLREVQSAHLLSAESTSYEHALAHANTLVRAMDAHAGWEAAWQKGRAMTSAQAVTYALQENGEA